MSILRDPKGYYIVLGIVEDADERVIKAAFRAKAKRLHPDFNPSPIAAKQFHRLHEAYATLVDPKRRAAYDRPWKSERPRSEAPRGPEPRPETETRQDTETRSRPEPKPEPKPEPRRPEPKPEPPPRRVAPDTAATCQCGQITAQPRYIVFDMVWGQLQRVQRRTVSGVFCRTCADRAAIKASLISWLAGWWCWPDGPRETVRAILNNMRGGRKPADRNARLLMRQARAFKSRGDDELAYNAALQARSFAQSSDVRRDVERLIGSLGPAPTRVLKDRWARPGWAPTIQMMPLALLGAVVATGVTLSLPTPAMTKPSSKPAPAVVQAPPKPQRTFKVVAETAPMRTGPNEIFELVATLTRGDRVTSLEADPTGTWLRVMRPDGTAGFIATAQLGPAE